MATLQQFSFFTQEPREYATRADPVRNIGLDELAVGDVREQVSTNEQSQIGKEIGGNGRHFELAQSGPQAQVPQTEMENRGYGGETAAYSQEQEQEILGDRSEQVDIGSSA